MNLRSILSKTRNSSRTLFPSRSESSILRSPKPYISHEIVRNGLESQFSKESLNSLGVLNPGGIPEFLKFDRENQITTLPNGLRVCSEVWDYPVIGVGVFILAGSRHETLDTSGTAHFMEHIHFKGTGKRTRIRIEQELENMGAHLNAFTSREVTCYHIETFRENVSGAMDILGDILLRSEYKREAVEGERGTILQESEEVNKDRFEVTMENVYASAYPESMMGKPILGQRESIQSITREMILNFHDSMYDPKHMVLVGTGGLDHTELCYLADKYFTHTKNYVDSSAKTENPENPKFHSGSVFVRDDLIEEVNSGIFFPAPKWREEDYFPFLLIERIMGQYREDVEGEFMGDIDTQFTTMQNLLRESHNNGCHISKQMAVYTPYSDCAVFGNYFAGDIDTMAANNYIGAFVPKLLAQYLTDAEVERAKNKLLNELSQIETCSDVLQSIGMQMLYLDRRVSRTELGKRISYFEAKDLREVMKKWFANTEPLIVNWAPPSAILDGGAYLPMKFRSSSTANYIQQQVANLQPKDI